MESGISRPDIISSLADPASTNIAKNLTKNFHFSKQAKSSQRATIDARDNLSLIEIQELGIYAKPLDVPIEGTPLIFASKHVSSYSKPALTVHATGNPTHEALYGGNPDQLSFVDPARIKTALRVMKDEAATAGLDIEITMEATHHGPTTFENPVMFVEVESGPKQWTDPTLSEIASKAIIRAAEMNGSEGTSAVGFGGTHYSSKHTRIYTGNSLAIGHILSKHPFDKGLSDSVI